ncbi:unnamed protein product [Allacma fusca]|uniref:Malonyl-CoA:ACP transacylase (MAT) domain-containing protein n=1 Tax=Allacma fusca TaxID=39272 RepID=A0A8J2KQM8_9HEXA|nr:unnamed protein product [Allacma fusca]
MLATKKSQGGMTAVGLSWEVAQTICPPDVYPSCEHTPNSIMVSGPSESLNLFAKKLVAKGVFVRNVQTCGFAPHSPYMNEASQLLEEYLKDIIPNEIPRSNKWISTTALKTDWESPELKAGKGLTGHELKVYFNYKISHLYNAAYLGILVSNNLEIMNTRISLVLILITIGLIGHVLTISADSSAVEERIAKNKVDKPVAEKRMCPICKNGSTHGFACIPYQKMLLRRQKRANVEEFLQFVKEVGKEAGKKFLKDFCDKMYNSF